MIFVKILEYKRLLLKGNLHLSNIAAIWFILKSHWTAGRNGGAACSSTERFCIVGYRVLFKITLYRFLFAIEIIFLITSISCSNPVISKFSSKCGLSLIYSFQSFEWFSTLFVPFIFNGREKHRTHIVDIHFFLGLE